MSWLSYFKKMDEWDSRQETNSRGSDSPPLSGWVEPSESEYLKVVFLGVRQLYSSFEDINVLFRFIPGSDYCDGDIITLSPFGHGNLSKPCCSFSAMTAEDDVGKQKKLVIPSESLPKKTEFYQFLYLRNNVVLGASSPFFLQASEGSMLSVSSEDDFLFVHQTEVGAEAMAKPSIPEGKVHEEGQFSTLEKEKEEDKEAKVEDIGTKADVIDSKADEKEAKTDNTKPENQQVEGNTTACSAITPSTPSDSSSITSSDTECSTCASEESEKESNHCSQSPVELKTKLAKYWGLKWQEQMVAEEGSGSSIEGASGGGVTISKSQVNESGVFRSSAPLVGTTAAAQQPSPNLRDWFQQLRNQRAEEKKMPDSVYRKTGSDLPDAGQDQTIKALEFVIERTMKKYEAARKQISVQSEANRSLMEEVKEMDEKVKSLEAALEKEKKSRDISRKELLTLSCEKNILEMELREKVEKIKSLEEAVERESRIKEFAKVESQNLQSLNKDLEKSLNEQKSEVLKLKTLLDDEQKNKQILKEQVANLSRENDLIQSQSKRGNFSSSSNSDLDTANMLLALEASKYLAIEEIKALQAEGEKLSEAMLKEKIELQSQIESMKQDILQLKEQEAKLREVNENLMSKGSVKEQNMRSVNVQTKNDIASSSNIIEEMQKRLGEAAELYKKQFLEILSLKKIVKKQQKQLERASADNNSSNPISLDSNKYYVTVDRSTIRARRKPIQNSENEFEIDLVDEARIRENSVSSDFSYDSDEVQCLLHMRKSDSDTGEFIKAHDLYNSGKSFQVLSMDPSSGTPVMPSTDNASILPDSFVQLERIPLDSIENPVSSRSGNVMESVPSGACNDLNRLQKEQLQQTSGDIQNPVSSTPLVNTAELDFQQNSIQNDLLTEDEVIDVLLGRTSPKVIEQIDLEPSEPERSENSLRTSTVNCHYCEEEIVLVGDDIMPLVQHLHSDHEQLTCPVCGIAYDATLPIEYYQMHVETHFSD